MERELEVDHEFIVNRVLKRGSLHTCDVFANCNGVDTATGPHLHPYTPSDSPYGQLPRRYSMDWTIPDFVSSARHSRSTSFSSTASNKRVSIATLSEGASSEVCGAAFMPITTNAATSHGANISLLDSLYEQLAVMHAKHSQREHQRMHPNSLYSAYLIIISFCSAEAD